MKLALRLPLALALALAARHARGNVICGTESTALQTCLTALGEDFTSGRCIRCLHNKHHADHDVAEGCVATGKACEQCKEPVLALNECSVEHVSRRLKAAAEL